MRVALFDGILENHVGASFERALRSRGHEVFNTGRIGRGFNFAEDEDLLLTLNMHLDRVIEFRPDWLFCFRPASLPPKLLNRVKLAGIKVAAWFSDDPVLYDLSYGPVVNAYDLVLHCGNDKVLSFYEYEFGRPTGVNFPFWTDSIAFPRVWGSEARDYEAMFLGNTGDPIRRTRYFDLAKLGNRIVTYGRSGSDYFGLSGGYLDTDREVVAASARVGAAISMPQYFIHHRGRPTWFSGLGKLGFFEYPSRIIQYMAMGLPVINLVKESASFDAFPEMRVVPDVERLASTLNEFREIDLEALSMETYARFTRNFSAISRVLAFESLVEDDDWRTLSVEDRVRWFTGFDGTSVSCAATPSEYPKQSISLALEKPPQNKRKVLIVGSDIDNPASPTSVTARALANLGFAPECVSEELKSRGFLTRLLGTRGNSKVAKFEGVAGIVVLDGAQTFANGVIRVAEEKKIWSILVDRNAYKSVRSLIEVSKRFDVVGVANPKYAEALREAGHRNVIELSHFIDETAAKTMERSRRQLGIRLGDSDRQEFRSAPGFHTDLSLPFSTWSSYKSLGLEELASRFSAELAFVSFASRAGSTAVDSLFPFVVAACNFVITPRASIESDPLRSSFLQASSPREVSEKVERLERSNLYRSIWSQSRIEALGSLLSAEFQLGRLVSIAQAKR